MTRVSPWRRAGLPVITAVLLLCGGGAHAGLFDDEEARKAILDLRARIQATDDGARARHAELQQANTQLLEQVQQLRRSLLDLNTELETQRTEAARLRGTQEQLARDLADTQSRLKDATAALDERMRPLEPQQVSLDGKTFNATPDERRQYEGALAPLRGAQFDQAAMALSGFLQRYPGSGYADSARFWLGNAQYGQKNYKDAIGTFMTMLGNAPGHPRAAEALLAVANCQAETKDVKAARRTIEQLLKTYPNSEAATAAKERLASLKG